MRIGRTGSGGVNAIEYKTEEVVRAAIYRKYRGPIVIESFPDPEPAPDGVVLRVEANGVCRSDWHGWVGHDPDIVLPHVPGHEIAGVVEEVGSDVRRWRRGDRVSVPFIAACGRCLPCRAGDQQVCAHQFQPGFHGWGGFAERVALRRPISPLRRCPTSWALSLLRVWGVVRDIVRRCTAQEVSAGDGLPFTVAAGSAFGVIDRAGACANVVR